LAKRRNPDASQAKRTLGFKALAGSTLVMLAVVVGLHYLCLAFYPKRVLDPFNISDFYPLSVFKFRWPMPYQLGIAMIAAFTLRWLWPRLSAPRVSIWSAFAGVLLVCVLANLVYGWRYGIDFPTATVGDPGIEYYHDAIVIKGPLWFLSRFNSIQPELLLHSRAHPPGPVLFYYVLWLVLRDPGVISIAVATLSFALALPYVRRLLRLAFGEEPPGSLLLYGVLPAVTIYTLASVDAVVASLFLAAIVEFVDEERTGSWIAAAMFLTVSLLFTFAALFLLPVMLGYELICRKRPTRGLKVIGVCALALAALKPIVGFDWWSAFVKASALENEGKFLLFGNPKRYLWYRLGSVAEILFFFTPFLCLLWWRGRTPLEEASPAYNVLAWLGPASLAALLLSGALQRGEAARICMFILPYLLLPVLAAWRRMDAPARFRTVQAVFAWGLVMQLFGFYQW
jgi:hypothetical protein